MRQLILLRGAMASGKSTWISENNLKQYTLCPDEIRLMVQSPVQTLDGSFVITQKNDNQVWDTLFELLEKRMSRGELTIIDATHTRTTLISKYKKLIDKYRYRTYIVDFTDVPIEVCKERNRARDEYKRVPEDSIDLAYSRFKTMNPPNWCKIIKPENFHKEMIWRTEDFSSYEKIIHIGDIHGCYAPLKEYFDNNPLNEKYYYIFVGDYIDRGIQNVDVIKFMLSICKNKNVSFLTGNHELWLWRWGCEQYDLIRSKEFINHTMPELDSSDIDKAEIRELYRKMQQIVLYDYETNNGKINVLVNHGGISNIPNNLIYMSINSFINGIGKYSDDIDDYWLNNTKDKNPNFYQIRGHRNVLNLHIQPNERSFCLEGKVEFGKYLRIVELSKEGFKTVEIKNDIYNVNLRDKNSVMNTNIEKIDESTVLDFLRNNNYINEKPLGDDISAFNFKRDVFSDRKWNELTIRARGLFVDTSSGEIVARSYNKFFNVGEYKINSVRLENLKKNLVFPVSAYIKENGFLGLLSYNKKKDELFYASKTTNSGPYRDLFKDILNSYKNFDEDEIKKYLKENNNTLVFEALDPINDPHIMDVERRNAILLDIIKNDYVFQKIPYNDLLFFGAFYGIPAKTFAFNLESYDEFEELINNMNNYNYKLNGSRIEGFVFEDSIGFMTKIKTGYYNFWKSMRSVKESYVKGRTINLAGLHTAHSNYFYGWLKTKDKEYIHSVGIPELRRKYMEESGISDD